MQKSVRISICAVVILYSFTICGAQEVTDKNEETVEGVENSEISTNTNANPSIYLPIFIDLNETEIKTLNNESQPESKEPENGEIKETESQSGMPSLLVFLPPPESGQPIEVDRIGMDYEDEDDESDYADYGDRPKVILDLVPPEEDNSTMSTWFNNGTGELMDDAISNIKEIEDNLLVADTEPIGNSTLNAEGTGLHNSYSSYPSTHSTSYTHSSHHNHYDEPSYVKPLKQSHVHRDPYDTFDHYDVIRTKDYDKDTHSGHHGKTAYGNHRPVHTHSHHKTYGHTHGHFTPYHYDPHKIPECAHQNHYHYNITFCLEDHYYPTETILWAIRQSGHYAQQLLSDVTYQSADNLVDGLTRTQEEGYNYNHYFGAPHSSHHNLDKYKPPYNGYSYKTDYYKHGGGYICPSDIFYSRPRRAMNTYGKWKVIVNVDVSKEPHGGYGTGDSKHYTQTLRLEQCIYPNSPCSYIDSHYYSRCLQKHNFIRMVAWTYEDGLHVDSFKLPIACSCHVQESQVFHKSKVTPSYGHGHGHEHGYGHTNSYVPTVSPKQALVGHIHHGKTSLLNGKTSLINTFLGIPNHHH